MTDPAEDLPGAERDSANAVAPVIYGEVVSELRAEVAAGRLARGDAIERLYECADGGLTWQGAADLFVGSARQLEPDGQGNATWVGRAPSE